MNCKKIVSKKDSDYFFTGVYEYVNNMTPDVFDNFQKYFWYTSA